MKAREEFLAIIKSNIDNFGFHLTIVNGTTEPRYSYTIGLTEKLKYELVFAGGVYYLKEELYEIFEAVSLRLNAKDEKKYDGLEVGSLGSFSLLPIDSSWNKLMMLGIYDYYGLEDIITLQIIPDLAHLTLDIPKMSRKYDPDAEPVWKWLSTEWNYSVPADSTVITNVKAMLGEPITEVMRWDDSEWEMFAGAGPDVSKEDVRVVSLGTILGIDITLLPSLNLDIDTGIWREDIGSGWNSWK